jgi:hypothetical protein
MTFNIENRPKPETDDPLLKPIVDRIKSDIVDRVYKCKVSVGTSGNVYIYRAMEKIPSPVFPEK